ncbi:MAG TPA: hypothetical protein VL371_15605 [Gemmataceae bacterium]|jgi:hypothetical protein|nr:hypothetical protein [Gemmataceae bacterium]
MTRLVPRAILLVLILPCGCARQAPGPVVTVGAPSGIITWTASAAQEKAVHGVDDAAVFYEGTTFVVWSNFTGGGGSSTSGSDGMRCRGHVMSRDGHKVEFSCQTKDGKTGPVTVAESNYDLKDGNLFLVTYDGKRLRVSQLKRDLSNVQFTRDKLEALARQDKELVSFFAQGGKPE